MLIQLQLLSSIRHSFSLPCSPAMFPQAAKASIPVIRKYCSMYEFALSEQFYPPQQQIDQVAVEDAAFVIKIMRYIRADDDLFEKILGKHQ